MKEGIFVIKRIYKDFIIAFLNSRGEIPFTFLKERLKEETLLNPHSKAISINLQQQPACILYPEINNIFFKPEPRRCLKSLRQK